MGPVPNGARLVTGRLGITLLTVFLASRPAVCQSVGATLSESLRANVVQITAVRPDGTHTGFGFIVGEDAESRYVATANHVVRGEGPGSTATEVTVRYFSDPSSSYEARLLGESSREYDLAVIAASGPPQLAWHRTVLADPDELARGDPLWFVGRGSDWYVPTSPGNLNATTLDFRVRIDGLQVAVGSSGAPVIADGGIIGLLTVHDGAVSEALSIEMIERAVGLWNVPWMLEPLVALTEIADLSPETEMRVAAGERFAAASNYARALDEFRQALEFDPRNTRIHFLMASMMRRELWWELSMPGDLLPDTRAMAGRAEFQASADDALSILYRARGIDPSLDRDPRWLLEEAYLLRARGDWLRAEDVVDTALEQAPDDLEIVAELGMLKGLVTARDFDDDVRQQRRDDGMALLLRATEERPANAKYLYYLATVSSLSSALDASRYFYRAATTSAEGEEDRSYRLAASDRLAEVFAGWGRLGEGVDLNEDIARELIPMIEYSIGQTDVWRTQRDLEVLLARAYERTGRVDEAVALLHELVEPAIAGDASVEPHVLVALGQTLATSGSDPELLLVIDLLVGRETILGVSLDPQQLVVSWDWGTGLAESAGLEVGDWIREVGGRSVETVPDLVDAITSVDVGAPVTFTVQRDYAMDTLTGPRPPSHASARGVGFLGVRPRGGDREVAVLEVTPGSAAAVAGLRPGDRILRVNETAITGLSHFLYLVAGLSPGRPATLSIVRDTELIALEVVAGVRPD